MEPDRVCTRCRHPHSTCECTPMQLADTYGLDRLDIEQRQRRAVKSELDALQHWRPRWTLNMDPEQFAALVESIRARTLIRDFGGVDE